MIVAEGLTMYLKDTEAKRLIQRVSEHVPIGELLFDTYSSPGIRMQKLVPAVRNELDVEMVVADASGPKIPSRSRSTTLLPETFSVTWHCSCRHRNAVIRVLRRCPGPDRG